LRRQPQKALGAALFLLAVLLGGCENPKDVIPPVCPKATILHEAGALTRFRDGAGRDLIDVDFEGEITAISGECRYDIDDDTGAGAIDMRVRAEFEFTRGPANSDSVAAFDYFVVLTDAAGEVISKQVFPFKSEFWTNRTVITDRDAPVELTIPVKAGQSGEDFLVFVGFQLSRDELLYNRNR